MSASQDVSKLERVNLRLISSAEKKSNKKFYGAVETGDMTNTKTGARKMMVLASLILLSAGLLSGGVVYFKNGMNIQQTQKSLNPPVPGTNKLDSAYNFFRGKFLHTQHSNSIGKFTFPNPPTENDIIVLGSRTYAVPSMMDVTEDYSCQKRMKASSATQTASTYDMKSQADSSSYGYDSTATVGVSIPVGGGDASVSQDVRTALMFGNEDAMSESRSYVSQDYSYRTDATYEARVYDTRVAWENSASGFTFNADFVQRLKDVASNANANDRNKKVFKFFDDFGSHVISKAILGAKCWSSIFFQAGYEASSYEKVETTVKNNEVEFFGFKFGSDESSTSVHGEDLSTSVSYTQTAVQCEAIVENNGCDHEQAPVSLQPNIMQAEPLPVWELPIDGVNSQVKEAFIETLNNLVTAATNCKQSACSARNGEGVCRLKDSIWDAVRSGSFSGVFDNSIFTSDCICKSGIPPDCRPPPPPRCSLNMDRFNCPQHDIRHVTNVATMDQCESECMKEPACKFLVHEPARQICYLKTGTNNFEFDDRFICKKCREVQTSVKCERTLEKDMYGYDLQAKIPVFDINHCETLCLARNECTGYVYDWVPNRCFLKNGWNALTPRALTTSAKCREMK